jgi:small-conductance mechanosensitive channel
MLDELTALLFHPARWMELRELSLRERTLLSALVLGLSIAAAAGAGLLVGRVIRSLDSGAPDAGERTARVRRAIALLLGSLGSYLAVEVAPLPPRLEAALAGALFVLGSLVGARLAIGAVMLLFGRAVARSPGERDRLEREYLPLVSKLVTLGVGLVWVIVVLRHFGQDVSSLVAALGVGSLAIGLAAQQTLGNMFAGFTLAVDRPFRPGDRIRLASGEAGEVLEIGVRSTRIVLSDKNLLVVPNTELANSRVVNLGAPSSVVRGEVRVTVVYGTEVERALSALRASAGDQRILARPEPVARVAQLTERGIELAVGFDVRSSDEAQLAEDAVRRAVLAGFAEQGILIATSTPVATQR